MSADRDGGAYDPDLDAAEYVLGTLDLAERRSFAERLATSGTMRASVLAWQNRLAGLSEAVAPVAPPAQIWPQIERATRGAGAKTHAFKVIDGGGFAGPSPKLKESRNRWRAAALLSGSIAAALLVFIANREISPRGTGEAVTYVAAVNRGGDKPALLIRVDLRTRRVFVRPVAAEAPAGKSLELWYINDGKAPRSMGVVDKAPETLPIPTDAKDAAGATFAISVEPPGGSKTGGPTGPVVYAGQLIKE